MKNSILKALAVTALISTSIVAQPVHANAGNFARGVAVGAAAVIIGNEVHKRHKRKYKKRYTTRTYTPRTVRSQADIDAMYDIQTRLNVLGYNAGNPDGVAGRNTRAAIRAFQSANALPVTGKMSNNDIAVLYTQSNEVYAARANVNRQPAAATQPQPQPEVSSTAPATTGAETDEATINEFIGGGATESTEPEAPQTSQATDAETRIIN